MQITKAAWNKYIKLLSQIDKRAGVEMARYISENGLDDTQKLIDYAIALVNKYGEASATLAAQVYDEMAEMAKANVPAAVPAQVAASSDIAKAINGNRHSAPVMEQVVSRFVKQAAADTTLQNARRDGAEFAWIPSGDSCAFCITLASNGWQRASKRVMKGDHAAHIHANCDCNFAIRFNTNTTVEGYNPNLYLEQYENADGNTPDEKIKALRRSLNS